MKLAPDYYRLLRLLDEKSRRREDEGGTVTLDGEHTFDRTVILDLETAEPALARSFHTNDRGARYMSLDIEPAGRDQLNEWEAQLEALQHLADGEELSGADSPVVAMIDTMMKAGFVHRVPKDERTPESNWHWDITDEGRALLAKLGNDKDQP